MLAPDRGLEDEEETREQARVALRRLLEDLGDSERRIDRGEPQAQNGLRLEDDEDIQDLVDVSLRGLLEDHG